MNLDRCKGPVGLAVALLAVLLAVPNLWIIGFWGVVFANNWEFAVKHERLLMETILVGGPVSLASIGLCIFMLSATWTRYRNWWIVCLLANVAGWQVNFLGFLSQGG